MSNEKKLFSPSDYTNIGYTSPAKSNNKDAGKFTIIVRLNQEDVSNLILAMKSSIANPTQKPDGSGTYDPSATLMIGLQTKKANGERFWSSQIAPTIKKIGNGVSGEEIDDLPF